ncbi:uncharacterized protein B0H64DRAFT_405779 [Chaetomium fimeti]|uniref:Uncharacterized protein n=1 Tax=Chaetomium fimeti TaxID=1854472 RepID=A0AAE0H9E4_9PEZI|nr:hypothetical protein B0H64DRAFT_405779 [Chaetomium fimeti]
MALEVELAIKQYHTYLPHLYVPSSTELRQDPNNHTTFPPLISEFLHHLRLNMCYTPNFKIYCCGKEWSVAPDFQHRIFAYCENAYRRGHTVEACNNITTEQPTTYTFDDDDEYYPGFCKSCLRNPKLAKHVQARLGARVDTCNDQVSDIETATGGSRTKTRTMILARRTMWRDARSFFFCEQRSEDLEDIWHDRFESFLWHCDKVQDVAKERARDEKRTKKGAKGKAVA